MKAKFSSWQMFDLYVSKVYLPRKHQKTPPQNDCDFPVPAGVISQKAVAMWSTCSSVQSTCAVLSNHIWLTAYTQGEYDYHNSVTDLPTMDQMSDISTCHYPCYHWPWHLGHSWSTQHSNKTWGATMLLWHNFTTPAPKKLGPCANCKQKQIGILPINP